MTNSTFYRDGYKEGLEGRKFCPPAIFVYAQEYTDGYEDGAKERVKDPTSAPGVSAMPIDIAWINENDGCGPRKLSNSIRCF